MCAFFVHAKSWLYARGKVHVCRHLYTHGESCLGERTTAVQHVAVQHKSIQTQTHFEGRVIRVYLKDTELLTLIAL